MRPERCFACQSVRLKDHCPSPACPWVRCDSCGGVSAVILGKPQFFGGKREAGK